MIRVLLPHMTSGRRVALRRLSSGGARSATIELSAQHLVAGTCGHGLRNRPAPCLPVETEAAVEPVAQPLRIGERERHEGGGNYARRDMAARGQTASVRRRLWYWRERWSNRLKSRHFQNGRICVLFVLLEHFMWGSRVQPTDMGAPPHRSPIDLARPVAAVASERASGSKKASCHTRVTIFAASSTETGFSLNCSSCANQT